MSSFTRLTIKARLALGFALVIVLMLLIAAAAIHEERVMIGKFDEVVSVQVRKVEQLSAMIEEIQVEQRIVRTLVLLDDMPSKEAEKPKLVAAGKAYDEAWQVLMRLPQSGPQKKKLEKVASLRSRFSSELEKVVGLSSDDGKDQEATTYLLKVVAPLSNELGEAMYQERSALDQAVTQAIDQVHDRSSHALVIILTLGAGAALGATVQGWSISRVINRQLANLTRGLQRIASSDLSQDMIIDSQDELGRLQSTAQAMQEGLRKTVADIRLGADSVATASSEIAQGNADLSSRTEQTAANLEQTAASMDQMLGSVSNSVDTASQATQLATQASAVAVRGGEVVSRVVSTMAEIDQASKRIGDIIGVIDGIAFQTNILALNAAVEAARAGEQGRGFAVVATEVRNLAQRSAQAAKEIKNLITNSVEKVESGSTLVGEAGSTMTEVVSQVKRVSELITEIAHATREQNDGISQVNQAVAQLDQMTQQNAALVEQSAAAAESLRQHADHLASTAGTFRMPSGKGA